MIILGLNHGEYNSSAAIIKDGKVVAGSAEERFTRQKKTKVFPARAVEFCLNQLGIKLTDCDYIAQAWNPGAAWEKYNPMLSGQRIKREDYFYTIPDNLYKFTNRGSQDYVKMSFADNMPPVYYVQHHRTHAANAFFLSPFKEAAILTCDARGELECTSFSFGSNTDIKFIQSQNIPHSVGMFYKAYTDLLGYQPDSDEWKVMALSAFDIDYKDYYNKIRQTVSFVKDGKIELDQSFYKELLADQPNLYTEKLVGFLGGRIGKPGEVAGTWHHMIAKAMQKVSEEIVYHMLRDLYKKTKCKNLVLGGGFFMNSVFNGRVLKNTDFKDVYISYAPGDVGNSIGAALYVSHVIKKERRKYSSNVSYIGPEFHDDDIKKSLDRRKIKYELVKNKNQKIAELISQGEIVAVMNGKMEFGERALGNRSILGDPRAADIKDKINSIIKYREAYRPFAPAVLGDQAYKYFEVDKSYECNYMEKVMPVRKKYRSLLPAITHVDGSGRLQTVNAKHNRDFYEIIQAFGKITGIPIVLNTSFNINGEPVVLSPDDAISTFFNSGLKYLFVGSFFIKKD